MTAATGRPDEGSAGHTVETDRLRIRIVETDHSVAVADLVDRSTGVRWLGEGRREPLVRIRIVDGVHAEDFDSLGGVTGVSAHEDGPGLGIGFATLDGRLDAKVRIVPEGAALWFEAALRNRTSTALNVEVRLPWFRLGPVRGAEPVGMVPIEIGSVRPLAEGPLRNGGLFAHQTFACATSVFPLAHVGDARRGAGISISGDPVHGATQVFEAALDGTGCRSTAFLLPEGTAVVGAVRVTADNGRWQTAVDVFRARTSPSVPATPEWLRHAGAIYNPLAEGGGGIYQEEPTISLADRISSFEDLPTLLAEARRLGTDVLHLFDYWEKDSDDARPAYWHKGSYLPRRDLGGEEALRRGVHAVRAAGGHVLMYLEPFIVYRASELGRSDGDRLAARDPWTGEPISTYPDTITTVPWDPVWRDYIASRAEWLVRDIGCDGIFLDSFGWQWNWVCSVRGEAPRSAAAWNRGVVELASEVRRRIRAIEPEAVVVTEALTWELASAVDAGLDASFAWNLPLNSPGILRSPVRRGYPELTFFSSGRDELQLKQVFAAGHGLALSHRWLEHEDFVAEIVRLRRAWGEALTDGEAAEIGRSSDGLMAAMLYTGSGQHVLTVLNASAEIRRPHYSSGQPPSGMWRPLLTGTPADTTSPLPPGMLAVWGIRNRPLAEGP